MREALFWVSGAIRVVMSHSGLFCFVLSLLGFAERIAYILYHLNRGL